MSERIIRIFLCRDFTQDVTLPAGLEVEVLSWSYDLKSITCRLRGSGPDGKAYQIPIQFLEERTYITEHTCTRPLAAASWLKSSPLLEIVA